MPSKLGINKKGMGAVKKARGGMIGFGAQLAEARKPVGGKKKSAPKSDMAPKREMKTSTPRSTAGMKGQKGSPSGASAERKEKTFAQAFRDAREKGKEVFNWRGNSYTTELKKEPKKSGTMTSTSNRQNAAGRKGSRGTQSGGSRSGEMTSTSKRRNAAGMRGKRGTQSGR